ncbi:ABC transporter substrate-binding protein [Cytobacillus sp. FJAT-54145]|uniref:ABC transporter substrate-binding protein n=1 Tax=Cytobacillus spartinae TaxID=3299023 RepID=A0ABW6KIH2_9BACI
MKWRLVVPLLLGLSLIGCDKTTTVPLENEGVNDRLIPIKIIADSPGAISFFKKEEKEIAEKYGIRLVYNYPERLTERMEDFLFATDEQYDIYVLFPVKVPMYVERDMLLPLDSYFTEEYSEDILPLYKNVYMKYGNHSYGAPYDGDNHLLFYRKDLFKKYNEEYHLKYGKDLEPPRTWEEYDQIAKFLSRDTNGDGKINQYGTAILNGDGMRYIWFAERFLSTGGAYFDEEMKPLIHSEKGIQVLTDLVNLVNSEAVPPNSMYDWVDLNNVFLQGNVAMVVQWSDTARFSFDTKTWDSKIVDQVDWTLVPGDLEGSPRGGTWIGRVLSISKDSKDPAKAWQVIEHLTSKENSIDSINSYETINDPYRYSHFEVTGKGPFPSEEISRDFLSTLKDSLKNTNTDLMIPGSWEYMQSLDRNMGLALINRLSPEEALQNTATEWESITNKYDREEQKKYYREWLAQLEEARKSEMDQ